MKTQKRIVNISLLTILLAISVAIPILSVQALPNSVPTSEHKKVLYSFLTREQHIHNGAEVSADETSYLVVLIGQTASEREEHLFMPPYSWLTIIDGEEIKLFTFMWYDKDGELFGEPAWLRVYYHIFEPFYFEPGEHSIYDELSWYNGIGQDREQDGQYWIRAFNVV